MSKAGNLKQLIDFAISGETSEPILSVRLSANENAELMWRYGVGNQHAYPEFTDFIQTVKRPQAFALKAAGQDVTEAVRYMDVISLRNTFTAGNTLSHLIPMTRNDLSYIRALLQDPSCFKVIQGNPALNDGEIGLISVRKINHYWNVAIEQVKEENGIKFLYLRGVYKLVNQNLSCDDIINGDLSLFPSKPIFTVSADQTTYNEDAGTISVTITRENGNGEDSEVNLVLSSEVYGNQAAEVDQDGNQDVTLVGSQAGANARQIKKLIEFAGNDGDTKTITIAIEDDEIFEGEEKLNLSLEAVSNALASGNAFEISILDNEATPVIAFTQNEAEITDSNSQTAFPVRLTGNLDQDIIARVTAEFGVMTNNPLQIEGSPILSFSQNGVNPQNLTISKVSSETDARFANQSSISVPIILRDPENAVLGLKNANIIYRYKRNTGININDGDLRVFAENLVPFANFEDEVVFQIEPSSTAVEGQDYTLNIPTGVTRGSSNDFSFALERGVEVFSFANFITPINNPNRDSSRVIQFSINGNAVIVPATILSEGVFPTSTYTLDAYNPPIEATIVDQGTTTLNESDLAYVTLAFSKPTPAGYTVQFENIGTALDNSQPISQRHFSWRNGAQTALAIPEGVTEYTIDVALYQYQRNYDETLHVQIKSVSEGVYTAENQLFTLFTNRHMVFNVHNNNISRNPSQERRNINLNEGEETLPLVLGFTKPTEQTTTVAISIDNTGFGSTKARGVDYDYYINGVRQSGTSGNIVLTIPAGLLEYDTGLTIRNIQENDFDGNKSAPYVILYHRINGSTSYNGYFISQDNQYTFVELLNDDVAVPLSTTLADQGTLTVVEGARGSIQLDFNQPTPAGLQVTLAASGAAVAGTDFNWVNDGGTTQGLPPTYTIPTGSTTLFIEAIENIQESDVDAIKALTLSLSTVSEGTNNGGTQEFSLTNDDVELQTTLADQGTLTVAEGARGSVQLDFNKPTPAGLQVTLAASGVAVAGTDFNWVNDGGTTQALPPTYTIPTGSTTLFIEAIENIQESDIDATKALTLSLSTVSSGTNNGGSQAFNLTNDDSEQVYIQNHDVVDNVSEGNTGQITLVLTSPHTDDIRATVIPSPLDSDAVEGTDYNNAPSETNRDASTNYITIPAGQTTVTVNLFENISEFDNDGSKTLVYVLTQAQVMGPSFPYTIDTNRNEKTYNLTDNDII